jgi:hypothetical protein
MVEGNQLNLRITDRLHNDRDDPTLERAGTIFVYRLDHPRHGRSPERQRRFQAPVLGVPGASRFDWIGRFDCLHGLPKGRGTRNSSATRPLNTSEILSNDSRAHRSSWNTGSYSPDPSHAITAAVRVDRQIVEYVGHVQALWMGATSIARTTAPCCVGLSHALARPGGSP